MAISDNAEYRQEQARNRLLSQFSRYDLVLACIPILFTAAVVVSLVAPVSLHLAMGTSAVTSGLLVADALYFHPPTDGDDSRDPTDGSAADGSPRNGD